MMCLAHSRMHAALSCAREGLRCGGGPSACADRVGTSARGLTSAVAQRGSSAGVGSLCLVHVNLICHRDRACPAHQYPLRVCEVCEKFRYDAQHILVHRVPGLVERCRAARTCFGHIVEMRCNECFCYTAMRVGNAHRDTTHVLHMWHRSRVGGTPRMDIIDCGV